MDKMEKRILTTTVELRAKGESEQESRTIEGYAVKWEKLSETLGYYRRFKEKIAKNAFDETLKNDSQRALWNHDTNYLLGNTTSNTLRLSTDEIGLRFEMDLPNNTWGSDVLESVKRKDVTGVSFGFAVKGEEWDESDEDQIIRTITKAKLYEISPTPFPAYPDSEVSSRSIDEAYKSFENAKKDTFFIENKRKLLDLRKKLIGG